MSLLDTLIVPVTYLLTYLLHFTVFFLNVLKQFYKHFGPNLLVTMFIVLFL